MTIGVIIVSFCSGDVLPACLDSLARSEGSDIRILVVDNASPDNTGRILKDWVAHHDKSSSLSLYDVTASHHAIAQGEIGLLRADRNAGFAGGVNLGLRYFEAMPEIDYFWILNPDTEVFADTAAKIEALACRSGQFGLLGGRVIFADNENRIQSDGGRVSRLTGICYPFNYKRTVDEAEPLEAADIDYLTGAHLLISRSMLRTAGYMREDYFLYYEETDWAFRRGDLSLVFSADIPVRHIGGTAIGSQTTKQRMSTTAAYFMYRNRMKFVRRFMPFSMPIAFCASLAKIALLIFRGERPAAIAALLGTFGAPPPASVRKKISP